MIFEQIITRNIDTWAIDTTAVRIQAGKSRRAEVDVNKSHCFIDESLSKEDGLVDSEMERVAIAQNWSTESVVKRARSALSIDLSATAALTAKAAGKLPQFSRYVPSRGLQFCDCNDRETRADAATETDDDGCPVVQRRVSRAIRDLEKYAGFSTDRRRVINRSTGNWARSIVTAVIPSAQRCANLGLRRDATLWGRISC